MAGHRSETIILMSRFEKMKDLLEEERGEHRHNEDKAARYDSASKDILRMNEVHFFVLFLLNLIQTLQHGRKWS